MHQTAVNSVFRPIELSYLFFGRNCLLFVLSAHIMQNFDFKMILFEQIVGEWLRGWNISTATYNHFDKRLLAKHKS